MSDEGRALSKWQVALIVGISAAAAVGVSVVAYLAIRAKRSEAGTVGEVASSESQVVENAGATTTQETTARKSLHQQALDLKAQGNVFYKQGKFEDAIRCYEEALNTCPENFKDDVAKFHHNIAAVYDAMAKGASEDKEREKEYLKCVVDHCTRALQLDSRYVKAMTKRLKANEALGKKKESLMDVTRVIILDESQSGSLGETVARLLKAISQEQAALHFSKLGPLAPTRHLVKTFLDSFIWRDDLSEARLKELWHSDKNPQAEAAEEESPDNLFEGFSDDPFVQAAAMFEREEYHGILERLTEAVENGCPVFRPHALLLRGTFYILWRENQKALVDLEAVLNTPGLSSHMQINALIKKASVYAGDMEMSKVTDCFNKCSAIDESSPDALMNRARINLETAGDLEKLQSVIDDLKKAKEKAPDAPFIAFSLATAYHRMASVSQSMSSLSLATSAFESASKKYPNFADGMILYAMYLQDMSQFAKAEEVLNDVLKMEPDNSSIHFSLGEVILLGLTQRGGGAVVTVLAYGKVGRVLCEAYIESANALSDMILSLVAHQDPEKAAACMKKAISVDNSCIQAYDTLASIEIQKGRSEEAIELYDKAVQFSRSQVEMGQALVAKEVISAQIQVCKEYNISMRELASRAMMQNPVQ